MKSGRVPGQHFTESVNTLGLQPSHAHFFTEARCLSWKYFTSSEGEYTSVCLLIVVYLIYIIFSRFFTHLKCHVAYNMYCVYLTMCGWTGNEGIEVLVLHQKVGRSFSCVTTEVLLYFLLHGCIIQSWNLRLFAGPHMKVHCICFSPLIILKLSQLCFQGRKKENEKFHVQWACSVFRCVMVFQTAQTPH